ncbi:MAG: hypothetical protein ACI4XA_04015 [Oscillospiraceae bacterium]
MSKAKELFLKCLPMLIVLTSTGIFMFLIKFVIGIFYAPKDTVTPVEYSGEKFTVVQCYQNPSSHYYVYGADYEYRGDNFNNVAGEHDDAHFADRPKAYFILNETPLDLSNLKIKTLIDTNSLYVVQFDEFVLYKLEGQYGVFAPLREYKESATSRKNDLYVVRQLLKNDRYLEFDLPEWESEEDFLAQLEKIEWYLDAEYED